MTTRLPNHPFTLSAGAQRRSRSTRRPLVRMLPLALVAACVSANANACTRDAGGTCVDAFEGATILIVDSVALSGPGTLRQAILDANADPGPNIIGFNISGACPQTFLFSDTLPLPPITDSLSIRGYTQPGASPNTSTLADDASICVQLKANDANSQIVGLRFNPTITTATFDVSGLSIGGFHDGIRIDGGNYTISGNFIGLAADGTTARPNGYNGVNVAAPNSYVATTRMIGGPDPGDRNLISRNGTGVMLVTGGGNTVRNNFIGTDRSGNVAGSNVNGVYVASLSNSINDNLISGNSGTAIRIEGANGAANVVSNNRIGVKSLAICAPPPCTPDYNLGNAGDGVRVAVGAAGNNLSANTIAWNDGDGISLPDAGPLNWISANSMHDNGGLGIDLGANGVDPIDNDATAPAGAPNRLLNYPVLDSAFGGNLGGSVHGSLESTNGHYTIEFHADTAPDPSQHGEGQDYLGNGEVDITNAVAGANGSVGFNLPISDVTSLIGRHISAIARDADGNTSEFSAGVVYAQSDVVFADGFD